MAVHARIRELSARHRDLHQALEAELKRPGADLDRLAVLKKQKLRLKDEIAALESRA